MTGSIDLREYNRAAWDHQASNGGVYTIPVSAEEVARARRGDWNITLASEEPVPAAWLGDVAGRDVLCLGGGGGQQGPILAAAGGVVTVFDNSPAQLNQDRMVAARDGLDLRTVEGDMKDPSALADRSFDLIVHPCSNNYVDDVGPVWREAYRVLRDGGVLLAGFANPVIFLFDRELEAQGILRIRHAMPYSDLTSLPADERDGLIGQGQPLCTAHSLQEQIGGQLRAGFTLTDLREVRHASRAGYAAYFDGLIMTRAIKTPDSGPSHPPIV